MGRIITYYNGKQYELIEGDGKIWSAYVLHNGKRILRQFGMGTKFHWVDAVLTKVEL